MYVHVCMCMCIDVSILSSHGIGTPDQTGIGTVSTGVYLTSHGIPENDLYGGPTTTVSCTISTVISWYFLNLYFLTSLPLPFFFSHPYLSPLPFPLPLPPLSPSPSPFHSPSLPPLSLSLSLSLSLPPQMVTELESQVRHLREEAARLKALCEERERQSATEQADSMEMRERLTEVTVKPLHKDPPDFKNTS